MRHGSWSSLQGRDTEAQIKQFKQHIMVMVATDMSWLIDFQS
jgi:hypothetical protein